MIAKRGIYYTLGLVNFFAQKWLGKIRNKSINKTQVHTNDQMALPTKLSDDRAENTIYTMRTTDHITQRSSSLIGSLLVYLSKTYLTFQQKANTLLHTDLKLDEIIFYGKLLVH